MTAPVRPLHELLSARPLEAWVRDLREAVAHSEKAKVVTPDGQSFSAKEWLEAYDAEARSPGSGSP